MKAYDEKRKIAKEIEKALETKENLEFLISISKENLELLLQIIKKEPLDKDIKKAFAPLLEKSLSTFQAFK